jgi:lauroyl/myristoyl acyltransferase
LAAGDTIPVLRPQDLFFLGYLPVMALIAWCAPEASWRGLCAASVRLSGIVAGRRRAKQRARIARLLVDRPLAEHADRIVTGLVTNYHHSRLQILRSHHRRPWRPRILLRGRQHVEDALRAGEGGVLWIAPFTFSDLVTKMALHSAGFAVSHLSRTEHGFSPSRFAVRVLNPIWISAERRYLAERLVISEAGPVPALRTMMRRLRENRLISITVTALPGQRSHSAPFLNGRLRVAQGAPLLACRTNAALLPVFTVRMPDGAFATTIERPLEVAPDLDEQAAVQSLVAQYATLLESYALRWPDQYRGWYLSRSPR